MHPVAAEVLAVAREALLDAWALIQPVDCLGCGVPDRAICPACRTAIQPVNARRIRCDAPLAVPVWTAGDYAGPARAAILALKEHGRVDAARVLAPTLRSAVRAAAEHAAGERIAEREAGPGATSGDADGRSEPEDRSPELARVPTTRRALVRRRLDPLAELLRAAGLPVADVLRPTRQWRAGSQKTRDRRGRLAGDRGRFRARTALAGRAFLLVDDVATTGATFAAAVGAIEEAGGRVVACVALAAPDLARRTLDSL